MKKFDGCSHPWNIRMFISMKYMDVHWKNFDGCSYPWKNPHRGWVAETTRETFPPNLGKKNENMFNAWFQTRSSRRKILEENYYKCAELSVSYAHPHMRLSFMICGQRDFSKWKYFNFFRTTYFHFPSIFKKQYMMTFCINHYTPCLIIMIFGDCQILK